MAQGRLEREKETVGKMVALYCQRQHGAADELCASCRALLAYAEQRVAHCRFGERKPVCGRCTVHCYKPDMRQQIRAVMRYAGPRMFYRHPRLALRHLIDRLTRPPAR